MQLHSSAGVHIEKYLIHFLATLTQNSMNFYATIIFSSHIVVRNEIK